MRFLFLVTLFFMNANYIVAQDGAVITSEEKIFYEKLGLSQMEVQLVKDHNMPQEKIYTILEAGVTISEYYQYPWKLLGVSEVEWMFKRKKGYSDEMIGTGRVKGNDAQYAVVENFFLPGMHEWKRKQYVRAPILTGLTATALTLGVVNMSLDNSGKKSFIDPWICLGFVPLSMIASALDIHLQIQKEINPAASRFSLNVTDKGVGAAYVYYIGK